VAEHEENTAQQVIPMLEVFNFEAHWVRDGIEALALAKSGEYTALVIERDMPGLDGLSCLRALRSTGARLPVVITAAHGGAAERVIGLGEGADDYLIQPYCLIELSYRIHALINRQVPADFLNTRLRCGDLEIDLISRTVQRQRQQIMLSQREFRLLEFLVRNRGKLISRAELLLDVWGLSFDPRTNVVDVHICKLRAKIDLPDMPPLLKTVRGSGYVLGAL
jgi:two-component system, OmpR family, response regulator